MKKQLLILLCIVLSGLTAQAQQNVFSKIIYSFTDYAFAGSIVQTNDYGFMMVGQNEIIKTDSAGNFLWAKTTNVTFGEIIATNDSSYIMLGSGSDSIGKSVCVLLKTDENGNIKWKKSFGDLTESVSTVQQTIDSGYIITGTVKTTNQDFEPFVAKLNAEGTLQWERALAIKGDYGLNSSSIIQTPDTGYVVIGFLNDNVFNAITCLVKLDANGAILWAKEYTNNKKETYLFGNNLMVNKNGFMCLIDGEGILQTDFNGNILWFKGYRLNVSYYFTNNFVKTPEGNYAFSIVNTIQEIDSAGNIIFTDYTPVDNMSNLALTKDGGLVIIGNGPIPGERVETGGNRQVSIVKIDSLGNGMDCIYPAFIDTLKDTITSSSATITSTPVAARKSSFIYTTNSLNLASGYSCITVWGSGVENASTPNKITLYPNPATDYVNITLPTQSAFAVYNIMGQQVYSEGVKNRSWDTQLSILNYPNSVYVVKTQTGNNTQTVKFVVEH